MPRFFSAFLWLALVNGCSFVHYAPPSPSARLTYSVEPFHGYRTLQTDKGRFLCDEQGEALRIEDGRALRIDTNGSVYIAGPEGTRIDAPESLVARARIHVEIDVHMAASRVGAYAVARSNDDAALLVDGQGRLLLSEEGTPILVLENGATLIEQDGERYAYDVESLDIDVHIDVQLSLRESGGMRVIEAAPVDTTAHSAPSALIAVDDEGHVILDEGRPVFVEDGEAFTLNAEVRTQVDTRLIASARVGTSPAASDDPSGAPAPFANAETERENPLPGADTHELNVDVNLELQVGQAGAAAEETDLGEGVHAMNGGRASLSMLLGSGVSVDGIALRLRELAPLAPLAPAPDLQRLDTRSSLHVHAQLEHEQLPTSGGETNLIVGLRGGDALARASVQLHLVIDRSSSMQSTWPEVLAAARTLVRELGPDDRVQVVAYGTDVQEVLPLQRAGDGQAALDALARIDVGGGTNIEVGLRTAYDAAASLEGNERALVILLSDGVPNGGAYTAEELAPMASAAQAQGACTTTVIGLGNQFDPVVLRAIADAGAGTYHVARGTNELSAMLQAELHAQQRIAARDVRADLILAEGVQLADGSQSLALPQLRAGEERTFQVRVHVSASMHAETAIGELRLQYTDGMGVGRAVKPLQVRRGREGVRAMNHAAYVHVDKDLGRSLDEVAQAVNHGQFARASAVLEAHAEACAHLGAAPIRHRSQAARRLARAITVLGPRASHRERRVFSLRLGEMAAALLR